MLLGTFQPTFRASFDDAMSESMSSLHKTLTGDRLVLGDYRGRFSDDRELTDFLGFRPMWCFPAFDFETAYAHALATMPNAPDVFFLLNTDRYVRVDKARHYANMLSGVLDPAMAVASAMDPGCPDDRSEFLVNASALPDIMVAGFCLNTAGFLRVKQDFEIPFFLKSDIGPTRTAVMDASFARDLERVALAVSAIGAADLRGRMVGDAVSDGGRDMARDIAEKAAAEVNRLLFTAVLLKPLYSLLGGSDKFTAMDLITGCMRPSEIISVHAGACKWALSGCDPEAHDVLLSRARQCAVQDGNVLGYVLDNNGRLPGRNDKCPCGSGKKFKRCHGNLF